MTRSVIDPITRIEGHLRVEMEVENGVVADAWVSGGCFRGMELVVQDRTPEDAAQIVQHICGVCPVSHAHASSIAGEKAYGITISNNARIVRNLIEGAQFLHSNILWFYNLAALDYVNPLNALDANASDAIDLAQAAGTSMNSDLIALKEKLTAFAANGQLSIFSGNWFNSDNGTAYKLPPELDLICTAHYLEALKMQAKASEVAALLGGKMPHVMTIVPGGTAFVPTEQKLDDLKALTDEIYNWVSTTMIPDTLAIAPFYADALKFGKGCGRYVAWGVFEGKEFPVRRRLHRADEASLHAHGRSRREVQRLRRRRVEDHRVHGPLLVQRVTAPHLAVLHHRAEFTSYDVDNRYSWVKCPAYDGKPMEAGSMARIFAAYKRNVPFIVEHVDALAEALGAKARRPHGVPEHARPYGHPPGRDALRRSADEGLDRRAYGGSRQRRFRSTSASRRPRPVPHRFWEAPRGALYHSETVKNGKIEGYQIIIPSTWNLAPKNAENANGPLEEALIGVPVADIDMPINALRTVHSFDPCTACAVHVTEPATASHLRP